MIYGASRALGGVVKTSSSVYAGGGMLVAFAVSHRPG